MNTPTASGRQMIESRIYEYFSKGTFDEDMAALSPRQRIDAVVRMLNFIMPRLKAVEMEMSATTRCESAAPTLLSMLFPEEGKSPGLD